jgi:hypothetical protein
MMADTEMFSQRISDKIAKHRSEIDTLGAIGPTKTGECIELHPPRSEVMSLSLHTPEVYHADSMRSRNLRHDLFVGCSSEPQVRDDRRDFDIHKDL